MANLPLISPTLVTIASLDEASTSYHDRAREPVKGVARTTSVCFPAQISWERRNWRSADGAGEVKRSSGYFATRQWMLDEAGYTPVNGDKVTSIGSRTSEALYITGTEDSAHLDGANTLVLVFFEDQKPRRN